MKSLLIKCTGVLTALLLAHLYCYGQYVNKLYDYDQSFDWGWAITLRPDSSYFVVGTTTDPLSGKWFMTTMDISADGNIVSNKKRVQHNASNVYSGNPGEIHNLPHGGLILPFSSQTPNGSYLNSAAGLIKLKTNGDTVFIKMYTDTSHRFDALYTCAGMPNGDLIAGGLRGLNTPSLYPGLAIRTDSMGDTLWIRTYQKYLSASTLINTVSAFGNDKILVGACSRYYITVGSAGSYRHDSPWFMILDNAGNILKDTVYDALAGGGAIYNDMNGGYFHIGTFDSLFTSDPTDIENFPTYIAHLDTNFRMWLTEFNYSPTIGHREKCTVKQLHDSGYVVVGDHWPGGGISTGWASKIDRNGNIVWSREYRTETDYSRDSYLRDVVELPNGNLVFIGAGFNDSLPSWRQHRDVWLLGVDSNGCEVPGCNIILTAPSLSEEGEMLRVWPNPTYGDVHIAVPANGKLTVCDMQGRVVAVYDVVTGENSMRLPSSLSGGVYLCRYVDAEGKREPQVVRVIYER